MDVNYLRSPYHRTHYGFFYMTLPSMLRSEIFGEILKATNEGNGNQFMASLWHATAQDVCQLPEGAALPRDLDLSQNNFSIRVIAAQQGKRFLLITGPPIRGSLEAGGAVAMFNESRPRETLRYFTSESPSFQGDPWMVGEWFANGSRSNLGGIADVSIHGLYNFVVRLIDTHSTIKIDWRTQLLQKVEQFVSKYSFSEKLKNLSTLQRNGVLAVGILLLWAMGLLPFVLLGYGAWWLWSWHRER